MKGRPEREVLRSIPVTPAIPCRLDKSSRPLPAWRTLVLVFVALVALAGFAWDRVVHPDAPQMRWPLGALDVRSKGSVPPSSSSVN